MAKLPAFQFYPGDWLKDPDLRRCSKAAKGVWMDMLCLMFECPVRGLLADAGGRPWGDQEIAEAIGGPVGNNLECIAELLAKGVASRDSRGAIFSRRLVRDEETRRATKKRVQKHRCNADVTQMKRGCNAYEDEDEVKSKELNPTDIATSIARELRISDFRVTEEIRKQLEIENKTSGNSLEKDGLRILASAQDYKQARSQIDFAWGWQRFFGEGYWANRAAWKVKNGTAKPVSAKEQHDKTLKGG